MKRIVLLFLLLATVCSGNVWAQGVYKLVTDESELRNGGEVLIVCREFGTVVGQYNDSGNGNRRMATRKVFFTSDGVNEYAVVPTVASTKGDRVRPFEFTLYRNSDNKYYFHDAVNNGYLNVTSNMEKCLQVKETLDGYAYFSISIANGNATITSLGSGKTQYGLWVNTQGSYFSSYTVVYKHVSLYILQSGDCPHLKTMDDIVYWIDADNNTATACCTTKDFSATKLMVRNTVEEDGVEYPVTSVGRCAFERKSNLTSVVLPKNIVEIGDSAFYEAGVLDFTALGGVKSMKAGSFYTGNTTGNFTCNLLGTTKCSFDSKWLNVEKTSPTVNVLSAVQYSETAITKWNIQSGTLEKTFQETTTYDDASSLEQINAYKYVTLDRTLAAGKVYSFCSPFSFDVSDIGEGVLVAGFTDCDNGELVFDAVEKVEAGVPYLIRSDKDMNGIVVGATYVGALNDWNTLTASKAVTHGGFTMTGNLYSMQVQAGDYYIKDGSFYPAGASQTVTSKAFRAVLHNGTPQSAQMRVRLNDGGESTVIDAVMTDEGTLDELVDVYTLSGQKIRQRVSLERLSPALKPGLYVVKGRKVLIR